MKYIIGMTKEEIIEHVQAWAYKYNRLAEELNALRIQADAEPNENERYQLMLNISTLDNRACKIYSKLEGKFDMLGELTDTFIFPRMFSPNYPKDYRHRGGSLNPLIDSIHFDWNFSSCNENAVEEILVYSI